MSEEEKQSVVHEINSQIAQVAKWFIATAFAISLPLLGLMVSNHFSLQILKEDVAEMKLTSERVTIMWMLGGYEERLKNQYHQTK
jgi:hypothetical protein